MRSRYTAFAVRDLEHLLRSWHPSTAPTRQELAASLAEEVRWLRLEILATADGGPSTTSAPSSSSPARRGRTAGPVSTSGRGSCARAGRGSTSTGTSAEQTGAVST